MKTNGANAWLDTEAGQELQTTLSNQDVTHALTRIVSRMDTLESAVDRLANLLEQGPGMVSMVTDMVDEGYKKAADQGVDVESRLQNALSLAEKLTSPEMVEKLEGLTAFADQAPGLMSMVTDMADEAYRKASERGIDLETRLNQALVVAEKLTAPEMVGKLDGLMALADQAPGMIAMITDIVDEGMGNLQESGNLSQAVSMVSPKTLATLGKLGGALSETQKQPAKPIGPWGLLSALSDPELKLALGFLVNFGKNFGKNLNNA